MKTVQLPPSRSGRGVNIAAPVLRGHGAATGGVAEPRGAPYDFRQPERGVVGRDRFTSMLHNQPESRRPSIPCTPRITGTAHS